MNRWRSFLIALLFLLVGTPVWGYIVFLKDGAQIITREKYRRDADKVFLVLQNGTETFIDASEVDFAKTDELNKTGLGQARILDQPSTVVVEEEEDPATRQETLRQLAGRTSLTLPEVGRRDPEEGEEFPLTSAGFVDLWRFGRAVHPDSELVAELKRSLDSLGAESFEVFQGTAPDRVLVEMAASSERSVLEGLRHAAAALIQSQPRFPKKLDALELVMSAASGAGDKQRAGQFVLTRELADELISGAVEPTVFFYRHVQF
jgi:hypothetical protein